MCHSDSNSDVFKISDSDTDSLTYCKVNAV